MAAMASAAHLSCCAVRPSERKALVSSRNRLSFSRVPQRHRFQTFFRCVAEDAAAAPPPPAPKAVAPRAPLAKKPTFSMTKGQIVRVDKEKYLNSIEYYAVAHPKFFKGLDYLYEDRGEILDLRNFEAGEYALITWAGIPTAPAWLPTSMLVKSAKLSYKRT